MTDEATLRARHAAANIGVYVGAPRLYCSSCDGPVPWPCDTIKALALLDAERDAWRTQWESDVDTVARRRDAALALLDEERALADRLAVSLEESRGHTVKPPGPEIAIRRLRALAAYAAAREARDR